MDESRPMGNEGLQDVTQVKTDASEEMKTSQDMCSCLSDGFHPVQNETMAAISSSEEKTVASANTIWWRW